MCKCWNYLEDHPRTCKWLGSPPFISHEVRPFGMGTTLLKGDFLTMVINHLLNGMILQVPPTQDSSQLSRIPPFLGSGNPTTDWHPGLSSHDRWQPHPVSLGNFSHGSYLSGEKGERRREMFQTFLAHKKREYFESLLDDIAFDRGDERSVYAPDAAQLSATDFFPAGLFRPGGSSSRINHGSACIRPCGSYCPIGR